MEGTGFQIRFFSIRWKTKAFNRTLIRWGNSRTHFWSFWFTLGLYSSLVLLPFAFILLLYSIFLNFIKTDASERTISIEPVVPGITYPFNQLIYYCSSLILCSIVHELGHAIAAVVEDVNIIDVGANMLFILPVAYVNLSTEKFASLSNKKILKILCAGIWHNVVLALGAYLLFQILPFVFSLMFELNKGVTITEMAKNSPLAGGRGLDVGDTIIQINNCQITDEYSWYNCLLPVDRHKLALCIQDELIHKFDESVPLKHLENDNLDCCDGSKPENICFEYLDSADGILELPNYACLPARQIIENSDFFCTLPPHSCPNNLYCFRPILTNTTNLFKISTNKKVVIYLGLASDIYRTILISPYIPRFLFKTTQLPDVILEFTKHIIVISLGLVVVNVLPCLYLDGQYILETLARMFLKKKVRKKSIKALLFIVIASVTSFMIFLCFQIIFLNLY